MLTEYFKTRIEESFDIAKNKQCLKWGGSGAMQPYILCYLLNIPKKMLTWPDQETWERKGSIILGLSKVSIEEAHPSVYSFLFLFNYVHDCTHPKQSVSLQRLSANFSCQLTRSTPLYSWRMSIVHCNTLHTNNQVLHKVCPYIHYMANFNLETVMWVQNCRSQFETGGMTLYQYCLA